MFKCVSICLGIALLLVSVPVAASPPADSQASEG